MPSTKSKSGIPKARPSSSLIQRVVQFTTAKEVPKASLRALGHLVQNHFEQQFSRGVNELHKREKIVQPSHFLKVSQLWKIDQQDKEDTYASIRRDEIHIHLSDMRRRQVLSSKRAVKAREIATYIRLGRKYAAQHPDELVAAE